MAIHFRNFSVLLFCFMMIIPFRNASADDAYQAPALIRVGAYENRPKIYKDETGKTVGLFPDVLEYIAEKEGWRLQYIHGTWSRCLSMLEKNEIDIMVDVAFSEERAEKYLFGNETFMVNWAEIYTGGGRKIESLIDLNRKKIAVMKGSIHTEGEGGIKKLAEKFDIDCTFVEVDGYREVFELLSDDEVDAGIVNRIFGSLFAEKYPVRKTSVIFNPRHLRFAFPRDSSIAPSIMGKIDRHLAELKKDPDSIYNKAVYVYLSGLPRELIFSAPEISTPEKLILLTKAEKEWIRNHPVIRTGIDPEFAPFEYRISDGEYGGIALEYVRILNRRLGLEMKVEKNLSWKEVLEKAGEKSIDVLPCVGITRERRKFLRFSRPYISFHRAIITRIDNPFLTGLSDIENMKVAVQQNSSHEGYLMENSTIIPTAYETLQEALLAVSNGRAQAFVGNVASSTYWIRKLNLTNLKVAAPVSRETRSLHFAVRDDWPELVGIIDKGLASIGPEEENDIRKRWIEIEYKPGIAPRVVLGYLLQIAGIAFCVFLVILVWNYRLKREIRKRKETDRKLLDANKRLKKLDRLKSLFIASMSHELRTPLNSIIGFTGVILQGMAGPLNDKQKDHLSRVYNSAKHLLALITDVIDISKIEAGRIDVFPQDFFLSEIIDEAVMNIEPQIKAKNLTLETDFPRDLELHTDRKRLLQCVINYLGNAVKYTEKGGIRIFAEKEEDKVVIEVTDTGIGIPPADQARIFEAFERLDSHLRVKAGGTGLGLYLTRKLSTEILGGEVMMKSREGEGSTFGIRIPIRLVPVDKGRENKEEI